MNTTPILAGALACLLGGCASVAPDGGFDAVADRAAQRLAVRPQLARDEAAERALREAVGAELAQPLTMDGAVRVALVNNPGLQASYWQVGIARAELVQASRLPNPTLGFRRVSGGGDIEIERGLGLNFAALLTMPLAARMEERRFEQVQLEVGAAIERHAADTRRAWIDAVAARQNLDYARQVDAASQAGAELAERMQQAGNLARLDLARAQVFHAEAAAALARADTAAGGARERLVRLLGLAGPDPQLILPEHLPDLPAAPAELQDVERLALEQRLDVQAAKSAARATADSLGLTPRTRFVNALELGYAGKSETGAPSARGYELSLELPLFDWGDARVARAEATYMQAVQRVADSAVLARSEARAGYRDYRSAWEVARRYRDTVIPLRKRISREVLLRYNGMLASTQELLLDAREQAAAVDATINALRDFWTAHANLEAAIGARVDIPRAAAAQDHKEHQQ